jgi:hypothetical protein
MAVSARLLIRLGVAGAVGALLSALVLPALAASLASPDPYPRVAFVARNDVPFDSMTVGPVAGALGGVIAITPTGALSEAARQTLVDFAPEVVIIAGGTAAISAAVEAQVVAAGPWTVRRAFGAGRDETAAQVAAILTELGVGRPVLTGTGQIVGDLHLGGTANLDTLTVQSDAHVDNLNADLLDGVDSTGFGANQASIVTGSRDLGAGPTVVAQSTFTLPDRCEGPEAWSVRVTGSGYYLTGANPAGTATMSVSLDPSMLGVGVVNQNLQQGGQNREGYVVDWLFTDLDAGEHTIYQVGQTSAVPFVSAAQNRFITQVIGVRCA